MPVEQVVEELSKLLLAVPQRGFLPLEVRDVSDQGHSAGDLSAAKASCPLSLSKPQAVPVRVQVTESISACRAENAAQAV